MAMMVPPSIPEAPAADQELFDMLRDDPATDGWVIIHGVKPPGADRHQREIDFIALVPDAAILCVEVKRGGFEVKQGQWYALSTREPIAPPGRLTAEAMLGLDDQLRARFSNWSAGAELPMDCVILFTDTTWPPHLRPLAYPTVGLPDLELRFHQSLGERLDAIAQDTREYFPDGVRLDSQTIKDIQDYLLSELER